MDLQDHEIESFNKEFLEPGTQRIHAFNRKLLDQGKSELLKALYGCSLPFQRIELGERNIPPKGILIWVIGTIAAVFLPYYFGSPANSIIPIAVELAHRPYALSMFRNPIFAIVSGIILCIMHFWFVGTNAKFVNDKEKEGLWYHSRSWGKPRFKNNTLAIVVIVSLLLVFNLPCGVMFVVSIGYFEMIQGRIKRAMRERYLNRIDAQIEDINLKSASLGESPIENTFLLEPINPNLPESVRQDMAASLVGEPVKGMARPPAEEADDDQEPPPPAAPPPPPPPPAAPPKTPRRPARKKAESATGSPVAPPPPPPTAPGSEKRLEQTSHSTTTLMPKFRLLKFKIPRLKNVLLGDVVIVIVLGVATYFYFNPPQHKTSHSGTSEQSETSKLTGEITTSRQSGDPPVDPGGGQRPMTKERIAQIQFLDKEVAGFHNMARNFLLQMETNSESILARIDALPRSKSAALKSQYLDFIEQTKDTMEAFEKSVTQYESEVEAFKKDPGLDAQSLKDKSRFLVNEFLLDEYKLSDLLAKFWDNMVKAEK